MKKITTLLSIFISIVFFSCERDYNNPYDRECPPGIWTPQEFRADTSGNNITLTWKQSVDHFDGFQIERCSDSINWKILSSKMIDKDNRTFSDSTVHIGDTLFYRIYAIADKNQSNYNYSNKIIIPIKLPTVITNEVTNADITSATLNGVVTGDGGATVTERGFCYATFTMPDISKTKVASDSGTGTFTKTIADLLPGTTYYVRAYATNKKGTAYGEQKNFTTLATLAIVITNDVTALTSTTATFNGEVTSDGGTTVTERGFCYAITTMPDVTNNRSAAGSGTGAFSKDISGLQPGTTYYVRAYAINSKGIAYGEQKTFTTTSILAVVITNAITDITTTTATFNGEVTSDGGATVTERGFCYTTTQMPDITKNKVTSGSGTGIYTKAITGLQPGTTYYVRAYATNSKGTAYGEQRIVSITTTLATVLTIDATNITATTATLNGEVTSDGGSTVTERGFCYSTTTMPDITKTKESSGVGTGSFTKAVTGLQPGTTYYVRAYTTNSKGTAYGEQKIVQTIDLINCYCDDKYKNIIDSRDNHIYKTIQIGTQIWMAENLAYLPSVNKIIEKSISSARYYVYDYSGSNVNTAKTTTNYATYGVLYNWPAALNTCPTGWHLPSDSEWSILSDYLVNNSYGFEGSGNNIAKSLASTSGWNSSSIAGSPGNDLLKNNCCCFSALPGGEYSAESFRLVGIRSHFWSNSANGEYSKNDEWCRYMDYNEPLLFKGFDSSYIGLSVRCVKD